MWDRGGLTSRIETVSRNGHPICFILVTRVSLRAPKSFVFEQLVARNCACKHWCRPFKNSGDLAANHSDLNCSANAKSSLRLWSAKSHETPRHFPVAHRSALCLQYAKASSAGPHSPAKTRFHATAGNLRKRQRSGSAYVCLARQGRRWHRTVRLRSATFHANASSSYCNAEHCSRNGWNWRYCECAAWNNSI